MSDGTHSKALSRRRLLAMASVALILPAAVPAFSATRTLLGTVSYRERIALPPQAVLEVTLLRVSNVDASATIIGIARERTRNRMPITYRLPFDDRRLRSGHSYVLQARILLNGKVLFSAPRPTPVANGPRQPNIPVHRIKVEDPGATRPFGRWRAESIRNTGLIDTVESTVEIAAGGAVTGNAGCNRFSGGVTISGDKMSFGALTATRAACPPAVLNQEGKLLAALRDARRWMIDNERGKLILFDSGNREILVLARR